MVKGECVPGDDLEEADFREESWSLPREDETHEMIEAAASPNSSHVKLEEVFRGPRKKEAKVVGYSGDFED